MLILKQNAANSVPTPPAGKGTIFLDDSDVLSVKTSDGNVENFPTVGASNAQVVFMNGTSLSGEAAFTYDFNNNILTVSGNVAATRVLTDNLLYANGVAWDLQQPGGSNTQVQFNDADSFGGSANYVFNKTTNNLTVTGNIIDSGGAFYGNGAGLTNIPGANVSGAVPTATAATTAGTVTTAAQPNITSVGTLSGLTVSSTITGSVSGSAGTAGTVTTAAQPNITSVGTLTSLSVTGNANVGNIGATQGVFTNVSGNGSSLSSLTGGNVTGAVAFATTANAVAGANVSGEVGFAAVANSVAGANVSGQVGNALVAGTVYTNAQPNITSVGTLTSVAVTGNATAGNVYANSGTVGASLLTGTLTTAAQPNVTSVGTLSSLSVTGNVAAGNLTTTGVLSVTGTGVSSIAGNLDMTSNTIINLANPTNDQDAATKIYVDNIAQGLHVHAPCGAATPDTLANVTSGTITYNNGTSGVNANLVTTGSFNLIDGVNVQTSGTRILVKNEANAAHNGIYTWANSTTIVRATDFDTPTEMAGGDFTFVSAGTIYNDTGWVMTDPVTTVGTSAVNFVQFSGAGTYTAGTGLTLTGTVFSVNASQSQITSVGTLSFLGVDGNLTAANVFANTGAFYGNGSGLSALAGANVTGQVANALVAGTVYTAAQPNVTSLGTLTGLGVNGNITAVNITANTGVFTGNGSGLSAIAGANVTGTVSSATTAGTVTTAAQPNITSVGTLTGLGVNGTITGVNITANTGVFTGNGSGLSALNASNISSGTLAQARLANASVTLGSTALTLGSTVTTVAGLSSVTSTSFVGALTGAATTAGTVTTAAQPNITSVGTLSSLSVSGQLTNANLTTGGNTTAGSLTGNWTLTAGSRLQATYADLAEKYVSDASYPAGTVLLFGGDHEVTISNVTDSHSVAGVVSTNPAYIMNSGCQGEHVVDLALQGRVPVKVQGHVRKGDLMVSGMNGHAVANNLARAGTIIGKALQNFSGDHGVIEIVVGRV